MNVGDKAIKFVATLIAIAIQLSLGGMVVTGALWVIVTVLRGIGLIA